MPSDLINTREGAGEFDALLSLREGEPYFALVGRDRLAPPLVQQWADANRKRALEDFDAGRIRESERDRELRKSSQAEAIGWEMAAYKAGHLAKQARDDAAPRPTYSGAELPEETRRRDMLQSARIRAAAALNSAIAEVHALADLIEQSAPPCFDPQWLERCEWQMRDMANAIEPERII